jgi:flagellar hook-associated protein 1
MGISTLFDIAASGVTAQRLAIEVTGENIANVNTQGYSRQQVIMGNRTVININGFPLGTGAEIQAVRRCYDGMLQTQIVDASSVYQQNLTRQTALTQIEPSFNELDADGLGKAMDDFFGAWQDLSTNPGGTAERQALLSKSQVLVDSFHQVNASLTSVAATADNDLVGLTAQVSEMAKHLALVNSQIVATQSVGGNPNELMDQRDLLVQEIAEKVGISWSIATDGTASVTVADGTKELVTGTSYATLYTNPNAATSTNDILITGVGNPPPAPDPSADTNVTAKIGGPGNSLGQIGGTLDVRDSIVPGYLSALDEMAAVLVSRVNAQHAAGYGVDGSTGNSFFLATGTTSGGIARDSALTALKIAAALPTATDPVPGSSGNNVNALKIADLQSASFGFSTGNSTIDQYYNSLTGKVGIDSRGAQNLTSQGAAFLKQLNALRDSNSGVSLDEELTNLTKYQQAFQGSARVISVATAMLDAVMALVQ